MLIAIIDTTVAGLVYICHTEMIQRWQRAIKID
ncbi:uncharacterized protein METZ01_LOCUS415591 [marine metagenome]|uniref:Uncharacterized protein n=1 Tax=marine metagenome TaxID=408172 RepID=A0A382WV47_9ZZZZ